MLKGLKLCALGAVVGYCSCFTAAAAWEVPEATIRYRVTLDQAPTHSKCGYFVHLPNGGILPDRTPMTHVFTSRGTQIPSYLLWHNRISGMAVVFADPGEAVGTVDIYIRSTTSPRLWNPDCGILPSAILCVDPTSGTMAAAQKLSKLGEVKPSVHFRNKAGIPQAPLSVGDDPSGRPRPGAYYLLSHVNTTDPGETWIAPFTLEGQHQVFVNGELLTPKKRIDKWGGTGQYFNLPRGLNRIEVMATAPGTGPYAYAIPEETEKDEKGKKSQKRDIDGKRPAGGRMYLTWRTPKATIQELGGKRSNKVPMAGTSRMETRVIEDNEVARSGKARVSAIQSRNGGPVASVRAGVNYNFWFEGEAPLLIYQLEANTEGHPENTKYLWEFGGGARKEGPVAEWLFTGFKEHQVSLTVQSAQGRSKCVYPFYGWAQVLSTLDDTTTRREFRRVLFRALEAYPPQVDPTAAWTTAHWNNLFRTIDFGKGYYLLEHLFAKRWRRNPPKLPKEKRAQLENVFLDVAARNNVGEAMKWARTFRERAPDAARRNELRLREVDIAMFYMGKTNDVAKVLETLARGGGETGERAKVRLGDLALLGGDLNLATRYYAAVQNRLRQQRNSAPGETGSPGNWKLQALLEVSAAEHVKNLIERDYLIEAQQTLRDWERMFPLSKISGDYILQESRLYAKAGDYRRARPMLEAYVKQLDASSFLPDAAELLLDCKVELKVPRNEISSYCKEMKERLKFHPVAERFDEYL